MKTTLKYMTLALVGTILLAPSALAAESAAQTANAPTKLEREVRRELVMLPWFGVFDNLEFRVDGGEVVLSGQVTRPTLKSDAEGVVRRLAGVAKVTNNIEVLPLSPFDDRIRLAALRSIYGFGALNRYALGAQPSIRIIVKNGDITLEGVVANEMDANLAYIRAMQVGGAFKVNNELRVDNNRT